MMKTTLWFLLGITVAILSALVQAQEADLNQKYRDYLNKLPPNYYEEKGFELHHKGGFGDVQLCNHYYSHHDEYVTYCKNYENADMLRLSKCLLMIPMMKSGTRNECKPPLDKSDDELNQEILEMYDNAKEKYSNHSFYSGFLSGVLSILRQYFPKDQLQGLAQDVTDEYIKKARGEFEDHPEDSEIARKGSNSAATPYIPSSNENFAKSGFHSLWNLCGVMMDDYPNCRRDLYYILIKNGLTHLLREQYQTEGERIIEGWKPKKRKPRPDKRLRLKPKVEEPQPQPIVKKEPDKTPEEDSDHTWAYWLGLLGLIPFGLIIQWIRRKRKP